MTDKEELVNEGEILQDREDSDSGEVNSERVLSYWGWQKGDVTFLDAADFKAGEEARKRQEDKAGFDKSEPEKQDESEVERTIEAGQEEKDNKEGLVRDTSRNSDTSQNREVSTNDETGSESEIHTEEEAIKRVVGPLRRIMIVAPVERHGKHIGQEGEKGRRGGSAEGFEHEEGSVEGTTDTSPTEGGGKAGVSTNRKAVKGNEFLRRLQVAMKDNERAGYVTEYSLEEYEAMKALYLSDDGMAGLAILDHGDGRIEAVSGFNRGGARGIVLEMLKESVDNDGVNYVEAFDPLQHYYAKAGFVVDTQSEWNPEFAPENWNMEVLGRRDYFTMKIGK